MLSEVCDFTVEIEITDKQEVIFYLIKDGVKSELSSGSGFEKTASALALRTVLGETSSLSKLNGIILDEIWGRVAKENYDKALAGDSQTQIKRAESSLNKVLNSITRKTTNVVKLTDANGNGAYFNYTTSDVLIPVSATEHIIVASQSYVID